MNRQCAVCQPGRRCASCSERSRAHWRIVRLARLERRSADPIAWADQRTSLQDARTALCIAMGVPFDQIDPASGHDLSRSTH
jgi:hypothetical protein